MLGYLYKNRERPSVGSLRWFKVWAKRILNMPGLLSILHGRAKLKCRGAKIGVLTILGRLDLNGPCRKLSLGEHSFIASNVHLALHDEIKIGQRVVINSGAQLLTASHDTHHPNWLSFAKPIVIHDFAWIATNAIILPGVTIGEGAVVGAGAVVSKDVAPYTIVAGNPAQPVSRRVSDLDYSPVDLCAPYEAWLGNPAKGKLK